MELCSMPAPESSLPQDWLALADQALQAAEILLTEQGPLPVVAFHLQQTVENISRAICSSNHANPPAHACKVAH
jgi:hypothetical protein